MAFSANDLRPGMVIDKENNLWLCLESVHKTPGNLRAFVQAKMRNVTTGMQKEFRFSSTETVDRVDLRTRPMQYLYSDDTGYNFMDTENYEQLSISKELLGDAINYLLPELIVDVTFHETKALGVKLPTNLSFTVIESQPNMKSATATSSYKNAKIETGLNVKVPQFIEVGNRITVNTQTGDYLERAKN